MKGEHVYIVRCGETALKGQNKPYFERTLAQRIRRVLSGFPETKVERSDGLLFVRTTDAVRAEDVLRRVSRVFGVDSISPAQEVDIGGTADEQALSMLGDTAVAWMKAAVADRGDLTFKVVSKRADKQFSIQSPDIASRIGGRILRECPGTRVDVHDPDVRLHADVRRGFAYVYEQKISGFGGLPLGTNGKGLVLLSGGIDSPVAAFLMAHRGMLIEAVHFHSYPYTSRQSQEKVRELAGILSVYCGPVRVHSINILPLMEQIAQRCPEEYTTILVRRGMVRLANLIASENDCSMLITGESLGQVASQTAESIVVVDQAADRPVMRPLIAMDKVDIMETARQIGTYETSILPYDDCCSVFLPKRPATKPSLEHVLSAEALLDEEAWMRQALESLETEAIRPRDEL